MSKEDKIRIKKEIRQKELQKTPKGIYGNYKTNARVRFILWDLTPTQFAEFWRKPCFYCGDSIATIGLDRIDNEEGYNIENVVPCCTKCNKMKSTMNGDDFIEQCRKIICNNSLF